MSTYDQLPYADYCFPHTHPEHLYSLARWLGHAAPGFSHARVLELGCAGGGNLLPMALDLPDAEFVGIDLSARQVESANALAQRLGVRNASFRAMSLLDVDATLGEFDYVLCHGVYSWVPAPVRAGIFTLCRERLRKGGLAYVSYNTLPGWSVLRVVRDYLLFHTPRTGDPARRVALAREALALFAKVQGGLATPMGHCLRAHAESLVGVDDSYLFHEYLEEVNTAFYVSDFVRDARAAGLEYLSDADLASSEPVSRGNFLAQEQTADFLRNRRFRASVLGRAGEVTRAPTSLEDIAALWFSTRADLAQDADASQLRDESALRFEHNEHEFVLDDPLDKSALVTLAAASRRPVSWDELCSTATQRAGLREVPRERLAARIAEWVHTGLVRLHAGAARYASEAGEKPTASRVAREQSLRGGKAITTMRHEQIDLGESERALLPLLDGTRDRAALARETGLRADQCDDALAALALNAILT